ncbi:TPA: glycosyltransferase family 2 protein [Acinetobacter baumannii]|jgi:glycosyltransferase involved in cell wall biosynthesis|uniref:Gtr79 n=1 Tax=Acinetobacter baumannii TaxID=470 RepID=A0A513QCQ8_ACIBA|nr:family 2 glycosyl transferase [Acinetobacter baumannii ZW85-1]QBM04841.1 Gtr79 [Acinetobacter baumannii]WJN62223.1 glycosyltransferase [Acinetobacter baumannii]HEM7137765.1 glycosyltransferase family 2 protein [Acinetobacter baumannii]
MIEVSKVLEDRIDIALATYNGEKYITELLDSLDQQTYQNFIVHVCDDGSKDRTIAICEAHSLFKKGKLEIHEKTGGNGASRNFIRTLSYCKNPYIALCDQDDFWIPTKLEKMLVKTQHEEGSEKKPTLIFSDLQIVDEKLHILSPSYFAVSSKSDQCSTPFDFLLSNHVPGCTMMFNQSLKQVFEPIPQEFRMHDWWIILIAAFWGRVIYLDESLIQYRQHGNNTVGAVGMDKPTLIQKLRTVLLYKTILLKVDMVRKSFLPYIQQKEIQQEKLSLEQKKFIDLLQRRLPLSKRLQIFSKTVTGEDRLLSFLVWCLL